MNCSKRMIGMSVVATVALLLGASAEVAKGQCQANELAKLLAADGAPGDIFGRSVAIEGNIAVIGANWDDDGDSDHTGSAYVFEWDGNHWTEVVKLTASPGLAEAEFGYPVAISGNTIVIGAHRDVNEKGDRSGSVYVFEWDGNQWTQVAKLLASDGVPGDAFGYGVAISGEWVVIGAPEHEHDDGVINSGSAFVFRKPPDGWDPDHSPVYETDEMWASDGEAGDIFGICVAMSADTAVVGAYYEDDNGTDSGSAYVFEWDGKQWAQVAKLLASNGQTDDRFGRSVSISGNSILVGSYHHDHPEVPDAGSAYVFEEPLEGWSSVPSPLNETDEWWAWDGEANDGFGYAVTISGNTAVIGARYGNDNGGDSGSAYVFRQVGSVWTPQAKLLPSDGAAGDQFGVFVAVSGETAIVGAAWGNNDNGEDSGSAYAFHGLLDCNGNDIMDICDMADCDNHPSCDDCQLNGIPDSCELEGNDCNANGVPDECEPDCDGDGIIDDCDDDIDGDGVLNEDDVCDYTPGCEVMPDGRPRLDMNGDCEVNGLDIQLIVDQLLGGCSACP